MFELIKKLRKQNTKNIWFILGPSGAGKTSLGEYLASQHHWLHMDLDQLHNPKGDGIDKLKLRKEWDQFYFNLESGPLVSAIRKKNMLRRYSGIIMSFPSDYVLSPNHISAINEGVKIFYLYGNRRICLSAFLERERLTGRRLGEEHWWHHNRSMYEALDSPDLCPWIVWAFHENDNTRKSHEMLYRQMAAMAPHLPGNDAG